MNCNIKCCSYAVLWKNRVRTFQCTILYQKWARKSCGSICTHTCIHTHMLAYVCVSASSEGKNTTFVRNREVTGPVSHTITLLSTKTKHWTAGQSILYQSWFLTSWNYCCEHPFSHLNSPRQRATGSQDSWNSPAVWHRVLPTSASSPTFIIKLTPAAVARSQLFSPWLPNVKADLKNV